MKISDLLAAALGASVAAGCVTQTHTENTALRMARPTEGTPGRATTLARADKAYPSSGGDILKGSSPEVLAAARAAASKALNDALSQP
jgi:hypothetical protein